MILHCLNCNHDYDNDTQFLICPHQLRAGGVGCDSTAPLKRPSACTHLNFDARVDVQRIEDAVDCGEPFVFVGVPGGIRFDRIATNLDATTITLPIEPQGEPKYHRTMQVVVPPALKTD